MPTHGIARQGAGGTAAGSITQIGNDILLPSGGPWQLHGIWMTVVHSAAAVAESMAGRLILDATQGDLSPDPGDGQIPMPGIISLAGANHGISTVQTTIVPINFQAPGKSTLTLSYENQLAITAAPQVATGIIFGDNVPEARPLTFSSGVQDTLTAAAETQIGTITLSTQASRIIGVFCDVTIDAGWTADEECLGTFRLGSPDVNLAPAQFPWNRMYSPGDGTPVGHSDVQQWRYIPVDIPVVGGARIDCFVDLNTAMTNDVTCNIFLAYE
jgi:hypothetical protein